jgi:N-acetylmuramoyl-L-alanine amidase
VSKRIALLALAAIGVLVSAFAVITVSSAGTSIARDDTAAAPPQAQVSAAAPQAEPPASSPKTKDRKVVVLDPGHGGDEVGAAANGVVEKTSNLDMAMRVEKLLLAQNLDIVLTRRTDARAAEQVAGYTATRTDLQARVDLANAAGGDVFVTLHSNGSTDSSLHGVEAWYDSSRTDYAAEGKQLADLLKAGVLKELSAWGYNTTDRGLYDGACFRMFNGRCFTLYVIAGPRETTRREVIGRGGDPEALGFNGADVIYSRPTHMPAALLESLFITNAADATVLRSDAGRDAIARGIAGAIVEYLAQQG